MPTLKFWKWFRKKPAVEELPFKNEPGVTSVLIESAVGSSRMKKVQAVSGEFLLDPFDKKRQAKQKNVIYTGLPARVLEFDASIFPSRIARLIYSWLFPLGLRVRVYHRLADEPCTRDLFTGELLRPEKKRTVLIEKGVIDQEGYFLTPPELDEHGNVVNRGERMVLENCWVKPDFSDIDFIKSEFHSFLQSNSVVEAAKAMKKTGMGFDMWFYIVLIAAVIGMVAVVFIMAGGVNVG